MLWQPYRRDKWKSRLVYGAPFGTHHQALSRVIRLTGARFVPGGDNLQEIGEAR